MVSQAIRKKCNVTGKEIFGANIDEFNVKWSEHLANLQPKEDTEEVKEDTEEVKEKPKPKTKSKSKKEKK